jgi:pheromone shutdown protein TraB
MSIHLIGTIHTDLRGRSRLERALKTEKPEILTVETSRRFVNSFERNGAFRKRVLKKLREHGMSPEECRIMGSLLVESVFEFDVCQDYANSRGIPLHLIDQPRRVYDFIDKRCKDYTGALALFRQLIETLPKLEAIYQEIQELYRDDADLSAVERYVDPFRGKEMGAGDKYMARKLLALERRNREKRIVHVGGAFHFFDDPKGDTVYSKLVVAGLNPTRATLASYDKYGGENDSN